MMSDVALLELCKELFELSGWETDYWYDWNHGEPTVEDMKLSPYNTPAYGAGYLLRKLPLKVKDEYQGDIFGVHLKQTGGTGWIVYYGEPGKSTEMYFNSGDTPENALCLLAVELWKQGVITK